MDPRFLCLFLASLPIFLSSGQITVNPSPPTTPVSVPPGTGTPVGGQPVGNPVSPSPSGGTPPTTPAVAPPVSGGSTNAPSGRKWCVAKSGVPETKIQAALDYACGIGKADCSAIQQGGSCYNPNSLQNHASYAFNSYFQKNPSAQTSCQFGGAAVITTTNPSTGSCVFPTSSSPSSSTGSPTTGTPSTGFTTPPSSSGTGNSPAIMNGGGTPGLGGVLPSGIGESPANTTDASAANGSPRPLIACIVAAAAIVVGRMMKLEV